jgi:hypothetical protein
MQESRDTVDIIQKTSRETNEIQWGSYREAWKPVEVMMETITHCKHTD